MAEGDNPEAAGQELSEQAADERTTVAKSEASKETIADYPTVVIPVAQLARFLRDASRTILPTKSKSFRRPFSIDEELIKKIDRRVREAMLEISSDETSVAIHVRYADLSTETYNGLDECFDLAGDDADAESIEIVWTALSTSGNFHEIRLDCVTEKPLESSGTRWPMPDLAGIDLTVSGESRRWVRISFLQLEGLIRSTRLPLLLRPLEVFKHDLFSNAGGWILGIAVFFTSSTILSNTVLSALNQRRIQTILGPATLQQQFAAFVRDRFAPPGGAFVLELFAFMLPYGLLFLTWMLGQRYLKYLVPRSSISIGLSKRRYLDYVNFFKFLVFTVVIGSIMALIVNLISNVLGK